MNLFTIIGEALRALRQNRLRTELTMLGMIIGGATVSCELDYLDSRGTKSTLSGPVTASGTGGWQTVSLSTNLPHTLLSTRAYYARIDLTASGAANNDARFGSVQLTYSTTDSLAQAL